MHTKDSGNITARRQRVGHTPAKGSRTEASNPLHLPLGQFEPRWGDVRYDAVRLRRLWDWCDAALDVPLQNDGPNRLANLAGNGYKYRVLKDPGNARSQGTVCHDVDVVLLTERNQLRLLQVRVDFDLVDSRRHCRGLARAGAGDARTHRHVVVKGPKGTFSLCVHAHRSRLGQSTPSWYDMSRRGRGRRVV